MAEIQVRLQLYKNDLVIFFKTFNLKILAHLTSSQDPKGEWTFLHMFSNSNKPEKKNGYHFRQNGAPKFIQKNRVKWLMNWQHDATMKYYWTATTIAFIAHRQENEKEIVFYCYWRASNGIHFPWLENGFGMPFCFLNKSKGKGDKIPV